MQPGAQDSAQGERNAKQRTADSLELDDVQSLVTASSATNVVVVVAAFVLVAPSAADDANSAATAAAVGQLVFPLLVVLVD